VTTCPATALGRLIGISQSRGSDCCCCLRSDGLYWAVKCVYDVALV
jgi:hypothetical protein